MKNLQKNQKTKIEDDLVMMMVVFYHSLFIFCIFSVYSFNVIKQSDKFNAKMLIKTFFLFTKLF